MGEVVSFDAFKKAAEAIKTEADTILDACDDENGYLAIDYAGLVNDSLLSVVRSSLKEMERYGRLGDHHFYITFETNHPGVVVPRYLKANRLTTIVLQYKFSDLVVEDTSFSVVLTFNGTDHKVTVPFSAITHFADPYAKFGLEFNPQTQIAKG